MNGSIDISMQASGVSAAVPVSFSFDINGVSSHGIMSMDLMGQQSTVETYVVPDNEVLLGYFKTDTNGEAGSWTVSELDANAMSQFADFDSSMFENAQLTVSDSGYTVTMNAADMLGYLQNLGVNEKNTTTRGFADMFGSYKDALSGLTINCDFDKDCNLVGISIPTYQGELEMEGQKADITISCDIVISGQGTVAEITVPEDVVKAADNLPSDISGADDTESASVESTES